MKSSELIKTIVENNLTSTELYNLLTVDLYDFNNLVGAPTLQPLVQYFNYKITEILYKVIKQLKEDAVQ